ncbi:MAG: phosphoribosylglycinamide formyltransferase [Alphaproteobacteria bacterium]|nr:phosphoribosylglycinamide formyltransferase [Alphaproteobacteria bacterium]MCL2504962.1 phosphoribosylglycinamide formyltransferase [Alphaproteobacteria bacterium]
MSDLKIGILISGRGSNMASIIEACERGEISAQVACVISNKADAKGLEFAKAHNIPAIVIPHKNYEDRQSFEEVIDKVLTEHNVQLVCLAGFMRLLTAWFTERWTDRIVNIHPSLLPSFKGTKTHKEALEYGAKITGCTVHFLRAEMDHGPIIVQKAVPILEGDTEETLGQRVLQEEHKAYVEALKMIADNRVNIIDERVFITQAL